MKLYIIRHGETAWNVEGRLQGQSDTELNENGVRLAKVGRGGAAAASGPEPCFRGSDFNTECNVSNVIPCRERFRKIMRWS